MQTAWLDYSLRKRVFDDGLGECFEVKNMYMWREATVFHKFNGDLLGKSSRILSGALEYGVATLNICPDLARTDFFQGGDKVLHRKSAVATNIDAAEKGNVRIHSVTV